MADYSRYGHPSREWEEFIEINPLTATGLAPGQDIEDLQRATNKSREEASAQYLRSSGIRDRMSFTDAQIPTQDGETIEARIYRPKGIPVDSILPVYVFFHGGGFLFGTLASEDANCGRIVATLDIVVVNVCYRHTPHYKHPTQANDAWDAFNWVCDNLDILGGDKRQVIVGGVSAGGALAASVAVRENNMSKRGRIRGQVLCIPQLFHFGSLPRGQFKSEEVCSYCQHVNAPIIPRTQMEMFKGVLGAENQNDASLFVGNSKDSDVVGMPRTAMIVAGMDPLRDEALLYARMLEDNKVSTKVHVFKGLPHGFYRYAALPSTNKWFDNIIDSIRWIQASDGFESIRTES